MPVSEHSVKFESGRTFWWAIAVSALLHAMVWVSPNPRRAQTPNAILPDRWTTSSVEVSSEPTAAEPAPAQSQPGESAQSQPAQSQPEVPARTHAAARSPRPPARAPSEPARSAALSEPARTPGEAASSASNPSGSIGALELPPGVRHLAHAFTRALPASNYSDSAWTELPAGVVGRTELEIVVDDAGRIDEIKFDPRFPPAAVIERMVKNAVLLLKAGVFSIDAHSVTAGTERLALEVSLRDDPSPVAEADARGLFRKSYDPPSAERAGRASFTLNSGRHMEAVVRMLRKR